MPSLEGEEVNNPEPCNNADNFFNRAISDRSDARRYRFIRDCLTRCSPMMSNDNYFFFIHPKSTGNDLTEAIDKEMERLEYRG